ncbi:MAG TPA: methyltransferase domain-containing protein [Labilithrix sp.]|nr:methyltransferase domain-containing protein [Labilithrix sp.]
MDLIESTDGPRHPWEKSRKAFFTSVLSSALRGRAGTEVLDCGAGDAFFSASLAAVVDLQSVTCWDVGYDAATIGRLEKRYGAAGGRTSFSFTRSMPGRRFDLILMLDVIEHVQDDVEFVTNIVETCLAPNGLVLVSVPAWQPLFSRHDVLLRHYRRYAPGQCDRVLRDSGLEITNRGGLFHSLVLPRMVAVVRERAEEAVGKAKPLSESAAGTWRGGRVVTSVVDAALRGDNALSHVAARVGLNLPGLSYWALARKRG